MMEAINALFDELEEQLYEGADPLLEELQNNFKRLKADLIDLDQYQKIEIGNLHIYLDALTESISGIYQDLQCQLKETEKLGKAISGADAVLKHLRDELDSILNKI